MDTDVWGDDEPGQLGQVRREHNNAGYLAGVTASKQLHLQDGFDEGYPEGAEIGLSAGFLIGELQGHGLSDLEKAATQEMAPEKLFNSQYYDKAAQAKFTGTHPVVAKWAKIVADLSGTSTSGDAVALKRRRTSDPGAPA